MRRFPCSGRKTGVAGCYLFDIARRGVIRKIKKGRDGMSKYVCSTCGYEYDPAAGDPDGGIAPGTAFEDIPDDWVCPVCGVGKDMFEKV